MQGDGKQRKKLVAFAVKFLASAWKREASKTKMRQRWIQEGNKHFVADVDVDVDMEMEAQRQEQGSKQRGFETRDG